MNKYIKIITCLILVLGLGFLFSGCDTLINESPMSELELELKIDGFGDVEVETDEGNSTLSEGINKFSADSSIRLIAVAKEGSKFDSWIVDGEVKAAEEPKETETILMNKNRTVKAVFIALDDNNQENDNGNNLVDIDNDEIGFLIRVDINNEVQDISVPFGTSEEDAVAELVAKITVRDSLGKDYIVTLDWSIEDYQAEQPGPYQATGVFDFPEGAEPAEVQLLAIVPADAKVSAIVTVLEPEPELEPDISLIKTALTDHYYSIGDVIDYEILVKNTGNVTLYNVTVVDSIAILNNGEIGTLDPCESATVTAYYTIVEEDIKRGYVKNIATVTGEDREGTEVSDSDKAVVEPRFDPKKCETAWAYGGEYAKTFQELNISQKWGWSNGPLEPEGEYVFDLYAAAAQNDLTKGTYVGTLTVSFGDGEVIYKLDTNFLLREVHLYLGNVQTEVAAPGQLGYTGKEINQDEYAISFSEFKDVDFSKKIYVAAHAVVCSENWE